MIWCKKVNKFSTNDKIDYSGEFIYNFSTVYQRVKAKESEEGTQRIKVQSQQYLTLFITKLSNEIFFLF